MSALYDDADLFVKERPLPKGTLVRYSDLENNECTGRVKDASLYMLWIEDLEDRDRTISIRYKDLTAVLEQE